MLSSCIMGNLVLEFLQLDLHKGLRQFQPFFFYMSMPIPPNFTEVNTKSLEVTFNNLHWVAAFCFSVF